MLDATSGCTGLTRKISLSYTANEFLKLNRQYLMNIAEYNSIGELTYLQHSVIRMRRRESQGLPA